PQRRWIKTDPPAAELPALTEMRPTFPTMLQQSERQTLARCTAAYPEDSSACWLSALPTCSDRWHSYGPSRHSHPRHRLSTVTVPHWSAQSRLRAKENGRRAR